jgi:hypothetical protein
MAGAGIGHQGRRRVQPGQEACPICLCRFADRELSTSTNHFDEKLQCAMRPLASAGSCTMRSYSGRSRVRLQLLRDHASKLGSRRASRLSGFLKEEAAFPASDA